MSNSQSEHELHAAITASGQLSRDIYRLQLERFTEVLDSFRSTMLRMFQDMNDVVGPRLDAQEARIRALEAWRISVEAPPDG